MSGPKSSRYTLTAERMRKLLEEQERIRKQKEEQARKERQCKDAKTYLLNAINRISYYYNAVNDKKTELPPFDDPLPDEYSRKQKQYEDLFSQLKAICTVNGSEDHSALMQAKAQAPGLIERFMLLSRELLSMTQDLITDRKIQEDKKIADAMKVSFASVGIIETEKDPEIIRTVSELEGLLMLDISEPLQNEVLEAIERYKAIDESGVRENFTSITAASLIKRCREYDRFYKTHYEEFEDEMLKYHSLCKQLGVKENPPKFTKEGLAQIKELNAHLECMTEEQLEREYISNTIDEVIQEMGYEIIGQRAVQKRSGKRFTSKLLTYGDGTAINVTESSDGQITMEIGGIDSKDRLPDANEKAALQKVMESFCGDFKEIEKRLMQRGVVLRTRLSMAPPEEAYAQIINYAYKIIKMLNDELKAQGFMTISGRVSREYFYQRFFGRNEKEE